MESHIFSRLPRSEQLETERLILKEISQEVWDFIFTQLTDDDIMQCYGLPNKERLETEKEKWRMGFTTYKISFRNFFIYSKVTEEVIGMAGYHTWYIHHNRAEIGYGIDKPAEKQKGYMSEVLATLIPYGFEQMGLNRIEALLSAKNIPSVKLVEKFGFTKEGVMRKHYLINGIYEDSDCYALLKDAYRSSLT